MRDEQVRSALANKVSKERVGIELDKMLKGNDPMVALALVHSLQIYDLIFGPPTNTVTRLGSSLDQASELAVESGRTLTWLQRRESLPSEIVRLLNSLDNAIARKRFWLALTLLPFRGLTYKEKAKTLPITDAIIRDSVKVSEVRTMAGKC